MSSDFGLRGPKTPWVCPNDRQLALRAKLRSGWSVKTNQFNTYPKPQPLTDKEQQAIVAVIKRAEELDLYEQHRVGKLVDRLESLRRLASGNGVTECVLCGDSFGLSVFGKTSYRCSDCEKAVCRKCVVDLSSTVSPRGTGGLKDGILHLCKLCAENREFIKKSGAWFYKGVPTYILPEKKNHYPHSYENVPPASATSYQEQRYISRYIADSQVSQNLSSGTNKRSGGVFWSKSLSQSQRSASQSQVDGDSSSGDEAGGDRKANFRLRLHSTSTTSGHIKSSGSPKTDTSGDGDEKSLYQISDPTLTEGSSGLFHRSFEKFDLSDSSAILNDNNPRSSGSSSSASDGQHSSNQNRLLPSPSSGGNDPGLGMLELSILFDDSQQALHCSIHRAKDITPTDINGLTDSFVMLKLIPTQYKGTHLRTKTVHKTLQPVFDETLTFYGVTQNDMARQSLGISVIDEDPFGKDCLGSTQIPLHRIRPQQTRFFSLRLDRPQQGEGQEWGRGRLLLSLSFIPEKSVLLVGVVRASDLPALDHCGTSDPFVKVRLLHDVSTGVLSSKTPTVTSRKYKTSVKWKTLNPEFNEEFSFKVSLVDLPRLALAISVWDKDLGRHNDYIGGILLSSSSKGERLKHWIDMMKTHNTKHLKWHTLSPSVLPH